MGEKSRFRTKKQFSAAVALLDPRRYQVTTASLARFKKKCFFFFEKRHSFLEKNHLNRLGSMSECISCLKLFF
jgi:hypothetical protein